MIIAAQSPQVITRNLWLLFDGRFLWSSTQLQGLPVKPQTTEKNKGREFPQVSHKYKRFNNQRSALLKKQDNLIPIIIQHEFH